MNLPSFERIANRFRGLPSYLKNGIRDPKTRKKWLKYALLCCVGFFGLLCLIFLFTWLGLFGDIPSKKELAAIRQPEASKIYSVDNKLLGKYYTKNRNTILFENIPPHFMSALVATEDERFWSHTGIDIKSWFRVLIKGFILRQESAGGGSTLSQQLAKNLYGRNRYMFASLLINKFREWIIATKLENVYSKEELLTFYINTVPFGEDIFGLDAAADRFFSKTADQLTIEECALLVGLLKATSYYNPKRFPDRATGRRNVVLHQMSVNGVIDSLTYDSLKLLPINLSYQRNTDSEGIALYFRNHIRPILLEWCATHFKENGEPYNLYVDGLKIYTTIDYGLQSYAEEAFAYQMPILQERFDNQFSGWDKYNDPLQDAIKRSDRYKALQKQGMNHEQIIEELSKKVELKWWEWSGVIDTLASPIDSIKNALGTLQGSIVAVDPKTGGILVWVGGNDAQNFNIDYAVTPRHPGSSFKPFIYATAVENGVDPCTFYANRRLKYQDFDNYSPGNSDGVYDGIFSLPGALARSINTIAVQLIFEAGIENVVRNVRAMGMQGEIKPIPSVALGTAEVTLIEMTSAYTTFLNKGYYKPYMYISRIEDQDGNILEEFKNPNGTQVFSPETAGIMNQMMANVVDRGTAWEVRAQPLAIKGALAGKTGTSQHHSDGWFMGMSPKFVAGTWIGFFDRRISFRSMADGMGAKTALPLWGEFVKRAQADTLYQKAYFSSYWPEDYRWLNQCPFQATEDELIEIGVGPNDPPRDSTYLGQRKFLLPEFRRRMFYPGTDTTQIDILKEEKAMERLNRKEEKREERKDRKEQRKSNRD